MSPTPNLNWTTQELIRVGKCLGLLHFHAALAGNISVRVDEDRFLCSRHGGDVGNLQPEDLVLCDLDGNVLEGEGRPTSEANMHRAAYRVRADVNAVVHAHPPTATSFAAASKPLDEIELPEMLVVLGPVALVPYATPGTQELAGNLSNFLPSHDAFLLENHGALTVGTDLDQAKDRMDLVEQNAKVTLGVRQLGKPFRLSREQMDELLAIRKKMGFGPA